MAEQTTTWPLSNHCDPEATIVMATAIWRNKQQQNNNMAPKESQRLYLFSFSHHILKEVDTSNCKAMISMIKATCFFF
jgi:hypothetical protein